MYDMFRVFVKGFIVPLGLFPHDMANGCTQITNIIPMEAGI